MTVGERAGRNNAPRLPRSAYIPIDRPHVIVGNSIRLVSGVESGDALGELSPNFGDGLAGQAAAVMGWRSVGLAMTSIPSLNVTPRTS
jgi:hypothetical protein